MLPMLMGYLERLEAVHTEMGRVIEGLSPEALDWAPGPDMNSLSVLATHVAGSQREWIGEMAGADPADRDRPAEFRSQGKSAAQLKARLDEVLAHSRGVLERLTPADLEAVRTSARHQRDFSVAASLAHALEHSALHLGQMQLTRQMWDQRQKGS